LPHSLKIQRQHEHRKKRKEPHNLIRPLLFGRPSPQTTIAPKKVEPTPNTNGPPLPEEKRGPSISKLLKPATRKPTLRIVST